MRARGRGLLAGATAVLILAAPGCNALRYGLPAPGGGERPLVLALDPVDLPAVADGSHMGPQPPALPVVVPASGWLGGFSVEVEDAAGDTVPGEVLHHLKLLVPGRRELFMPIALRAVGAGSETRRARLQRGMGLPVERGDTLLLTAMLHNPTGRALRGVRVRMTLLYTPASAGRRRSVYPFFLHVTPPGAPSSFDVPPGVSERSWEARPAVGGWILGLGGHLHRYGASLRLTDVTTGRELWRTTARLDPNGEVLEIPRSRFVWSRGIRVYPDHLYRLTATYRNPTGRTIRDGGMGTVGGVIRPVGAWPAVDRAAPLYVWDLQHERAGEMDEMQGHGPEGHAAHAHRR